MGQKNTASVSHHPRRGGAGGGPAGDEQLEVRRREILHFSPHMREISYRCFYGVSEIFMKPLKTVVLRGVIYETVVLRGAGNIYETVVLLGVGNISPS